MHNAKEKAAKAKAAASIEADKIKEHARHAEEQLKHAMRVEKRDPVIRALTKGQVVFHDGDFQSRAWWQDWCAFVDLPVFLCGRSAHGPAGKRFFFQSSEAKGRPMRTNNPPPPLKKKSAADVCQFC